MWLEITVFCGFLKKFRKFLYSIFTFSNSELEMDIITADRLFKHFDRDNDGQLSRGELEIVARWQVLKHTHTHTHTHIRTYSNTLYSHSIPSKTSEAKN